MNKTIKPQKNTSRPGFIAGTVMITMLVFSIFGIQSAFAAITGQLDFGDRGEDVTELQTFLATMPSIYPEGLITGYFGPLTQAAVQRFQAAQGIVSSGTPETTGYGRVGPQTMARINSLMGAGSVTTPITWDTIPVLSNISVQTTNTSATFSWMTNEQTVGHVYYDTVPLRADEATADLQTPFISGVALLDEASYKTQHAVTASNLQPNTTYYYTIRAVDTGRGISMIWPRTFRTNQ